MQIYEYVSLTYSAGDATVQSYRPSNQVIRFIKERSNMDESIELHQVNIY